MLSLFRKIDLSQLCQKSVKVLTHRLVKLLMKMIEKRDCMKKLMYLFILVLLITLLGCSNYSDMHYEPTYEYQSFDGETYAEIVENDFILTSDMPVSTFSTDVDTASYSNIRRMLNSNQRPTPNAIRIEEMINYFNYDFEGPKEDQVISVYKELGVAPWNTEHDLLMIGLKAKEMIFDESDGMNLVFLIDVSGSMQNQDKLPLLKQSLKLLVENLRPVDKLSIVTYANRVRVLLDGGNLDNKREIISSINSLVANGGTAGGQGLFKAYQIAEKHFIEGGNNRILIASDGDFNVGISNVDDLKEFVENKRESGVFLSVLGFGTGNYRDDMMESIAASGNGAYYYIDSIKEAEKILVHEISKTMITVAKDVKIQIEFNPLHVKGYRLIGYENRILTNDEFVNDEKDAADMGSGHVVVAFYELIKENSTEEIKSKSYLFSEELRYDGSNHQNKISSISVRYKEIESETSILLENFVTMHDYQLVPTQSFIFASSVVEFGLLLRQSIYRADASFDRIISNADHALENDSLGLRAEFIELVYKAKRIYEQNH